MLAITGATGHLGRATLNALLAKVAPAKIVASLLAALQGVSTLLLVSTSELDDHLRTQQHRRAIDAARQAGVGHVVYTSVLNPSRDSLFGASPSQSKSHQGLPSLVREALMAF